MYSLKIIIYQRQAYSRSDMGKEKRTYGQRVEWFFETARSLKKNKLVSRLYTVIWWSSHRPPTYTRTNSFSGNSVLPFLSLFLYVCFLYVSLCFSLSICMEYYFLYDPLVCTMQTYVLREAAKKVPQLMVRQLRGRVVKAGPLLEKELFWSTKN